jgi:hypothetical protein
VSYQWWGFSIQWKGGGTQNRLEGLESIVLGFDEVWGLVQTLTDKEYQRLRDAAVLIIREMGVECGGSNVQMGINPADGEVLSSTPHLSL